MRAPTEPLLELAGSAMSFGGLKVIDDLDLPSTSTRSSA